MPELLFPFNHIPIARTIWEEHPTYNQELISFIKDFDNQNKIDPKKIVAGQIKHNVSESSPRLDFFKKANIKPINKFVTFIEEAIIELYYELWNLQTVAKSSPIKGKTVIHESWYHITSYGGYHDYHDHKSSSFAGIYFIDANECGYKNGGTMRFWKPFDSTSYDNDIGLTWAHNDLLDIVPISGEVIIFPGFLCHSALPYFGKTDRIIVAFNAKIFQEDEYLAHFNQDESNPLTNIKYERKG